MVARDDSLVPPAFRLERLRPYGTGEAPPARPIQAPTLPDYQDEDEDESEDAETEFETSGDATVNGETERRARAPRPSRTTRPMTNAAVAAAAVAAAAMNRARRATRVHAAADDEQEGAEADGAGREEQAEQRATPRARRSAAAGGAAGAAGVCGPGGTSTRDERRDEVRRLGRRAPDRGRDDRNRRRRGVAPRDPRPKRSRSIRGRPIHGRPIRAGNRQPGAVRRRAAGWRAVAAEPLPTAGSEQPNRPPKAQRAKRPPASFRNRKRCRSPRRKRAFRLSAIPSGNSRRPKPVRTRPRDGANRPGIDAGMAPEHAAEPGCRRIRQQRGRRAPAGGRAGARRVSPERRSSPIAATANYPPAEATAEPHPAAPATPYLRRSKPRQAEPDPAEPAEPAGRTRPAEPSLAPASRPAEDVLVVTEKPANPRRGWWRRVTHS